MHSRTLIPWLVGAFQLAIIWPGASAQTPGRKRPIVRQADHLQIESADPKFLFDLFTGTLQLPIAWPFVENEKYSSGGFGTGNFMVQVFRSGDTAISTVPAKAARYAGLALEPYSLTECLGELDSRGIAHGAPQPYISTRPDKSQGTLWTTAVLTSLTGNGTNILLYEYSPVFLNVHVRRNQLAGQMVLRKGGPLGVLSVGEIVIASTESGRDASIWQRLFDPVQPVAPGLWKVGNGPAIRLVPGSSTRIERMTLAVDSLEQARTFLRQEKMLGVGGADQLAIDPARVQGLSIRLIETRGQPAPHGTR
jgi:hypothetical protein